MRRRIWQIVLAVVLAVFPLAVASSPVHAEPGYGSLTCSGGRTAKLIVEAYGYYTVAVNGRYYYVPGSGRHSFYLNTGSATINYYVYANRYGGLQPVLDIPYC